MKIACILLTLVPGTFLLSALQRIDVLKLIFFIMKTITRPTKISDRFR